MCMLAVSVINIWADLSEKGAYGFSEVMRANDVDGVIYDVTLGSAKHGAIIIKMAKSW